MTIFYQGSLQGGIALAVREAKAVVEHCSEGLGNQPFRQVARVLQAKSVPLRLTAGSQEAGFLTSFCPISQFPAVVVIRNGMLKEYIVPDISKDEFRGRLLAVLEGQQAPESTQIPQASAPVASNVTAPAPATSTPVAPAAPAPNQAPQPSTINQPQPVPQLGNDGIQTGKRGTNKAPPKDSKLASSASTTSSKRQPVKENRKQEATSKPDNKDKASKVPQKPANSGAGATAAGPSEQQQSRPPAPRAPPNQYRLQVRLFDGGSVRSSFAPSQTIRGDVRPWLDAQMGDDNRPYNLKHILTPLPSQALSVAEESQTLEKLGLGSTANLVMVPVQTYTEAYATAGSSLPVRGASAVYNIVSSVASTATGLIGSFIGYGPTAPANDADPAASTSPAPPSADNAPRPRPAGPNIRTLGDQQNGRGDRQLYNGNQLNFEPRKKQDEKDK
ncbi:hypothetical protein NUU61_000444 [Penicillium alfredii]|uniref:UBX domain-containing protein n=1 Tax=Penicillium alfredii TaxID=1506179 RepID=A0A9W9G9K6_9EURO|nr:uncharacterized protein NUU61_000444 [Penicillium alfredii]KAJ5114685.1 hypothetical protein NUU61_000444 [Penicillium alfredii]